MPIRRFIEPMKAVSGTLAAEPGWAAEIKWDGMRLQVHVGHEGVAAYTSTGREVSNGFPELMALGSTLGTDAILDTEAVVFDGDRPSFADLQHRIHNHDPSAALLATKPVVLIVFDLLELGGNSLLALPYRERRRVLFDLLDDGPSWRVPAHSEHGGEQLLALAEQRELEGIVLKRLDSPYRAGRSKDWIKVKVRRRQEFVVGGWTEGSGGLAGSLGALIVGVYEPPAPGLRWAGSVGSGLSDAERAVLLEELTSGPNPFTQEIIGLDRTVHWVEPTVVVEVEYGLWKLDELLWHPVFRGRRTDRHPGEVVRELPPDAAP